MAVGIVSKQLVLKNALCLVIQIRLLLKRFQNQGLLTLKALFGQVGVNQKFCQNGQGAFNTRTGSFSVKKDGIPLDKRMDLGSSLLQILPDQFN